MIEKFVRALLLIEILDYGCVLSRESFEALFAPGIRNTATVKHKATPVSRLISRRTTTMKRETINTHCKGRVGTRCRYRAAWRFKVQVQQLLRAQHALKGFDQRGQFDWQRHVVQQPAKVFQRIGYALQEVRLTFVKAAKAVCAEGLHQPHVNEGVIVLHEGCAGDGN